MRYYEQQIQEFYAPIYALIEMIWNGYEIVQNINENLAEADNTAPRNEALTKIDRFVGAKYFRPIHEEILQVLKTKIFLVEGAEMPSSFSKYLAHSVMESVQYNLDDKEKVSTSSVEGAPWSDAFPDDIKRGLDEALMRYDAVMRELDRPAG